MYDVVALGELLVDFTAAGIGERGEPLFAANPGGAPCNVLAMLARLGRSTAFVGKVGEDLFGRMLKGAIEGAGIGGTGLVLDPTAHTTLAFVRNGSDGEREFSFYRDPGADELLTSQELPGEILKKARIFHFGSLSLTREPARSATRAAVELAKKGGTLISFDPNLRPSLWGSLELAREQMLWGCSVCQVLKLAAEELEFLTGCRELAAGARKLRQANPGLRLLLLTDGSEGSWAQWEDRLAFRRAFRQVKAIDTTGAGDTFLGCCLHCLLEHGSEPWTEAELGEMLAFANAGAGLVTTRKGALNSMPHLQEIQTLLAEGPI